MNSSPKKILVVRNDKLGDFMLTWPAFAMLKQALPECEIHALVAPYTADMAHLCPNIDKVQLDPGDKAEWNKQLKFAKALRRENFDAAITLYSTTRIGLILLLASISYKLAPATKIAQVFYHKRLKQRRSRSEKPEYAYNQDLVSYYLNDIAVKTAPASHPPYLSFEAYALRELRHEFCKQNDIPHSHKLVFIHPGCGGSANNLDLQQYAQLALNLKSQHGHHIVISAGPGEGDYAESLGELISSTPHTVYHSREGLERFSQHIAIADLFIAGSTGPLHIAGALNCNTAAFYPNRTSATALRWQTTNSAEKRLTFSPPPEAGEEDMSTIVVDRVAEEISAKFL